MGFRFIYWVLIGLVFIFLSAFCLPQLYAQEKGLSFQHLDAASGLKEREINTIVEDKDGFIWIGTKEGVLKYNGRSIQRFDAVMDSLSIAINAVSCSFKDRSNRLWFGGNGILVVDCHSTKFNWYTANHPSANGLGNNDITAITQTGDGKIWIGTRLGLFLWNEQTNHFTKFAHDTIGDKKTVYYNNRIIQIIPDENSNLWISTISGLYYFNTKTNSFTGYFIQTIQPNLNNNPIACMAMDQKGNLWCGILHAGLFKFDTGSRAFKTIHTSSQFQNIKDLHCGASDVIWMVCSNSGLLKYDINTKKYVQYSHNPFDNSSIATNNLSCIYEDHNHLLWLGTVGKGVDRLTPNAEKFTLIAPHSGDRYSLPENDITCACESANEALWFGSKNGLIYFNRKTKEYKAYYTEENNVNSISSNCINAIARDETNNLWIATDYGLNYFNVKTQTWKRFFHSEKEGNTVPGNLIFDLLVAADGTLWMATSSGVCHYNPRTARFQSEFNTAAIKLFIRAYYTYIHEAPDHTFWASTSRNGVYHFNSKFEIIKHYTTKDNLLFNHVNQICSKSDGTIFMATSKGVLIGNSRRNDGFKNLTINAFRIGQVHSFCFSDSSTLWLSTDIGLVRLIIDSINKINEAHQFIIADGIRHSNFNTAAAIRLKNGELIFGELDGMVWFNPNTIALNKQIPHAYIATCKAFHNNIIINYDKDGLPNIDLAFDQNFIDLEMAANNFDHPELNQFAYQLIGIDKQKIYNGTTNTITYTNLPSGTYILKIWAANNDGVWNPASADYKIIIETPFWKLIQFRIAGIFIIFVLLILLIRYQFRRIKRKATIKNQFERQLAEARLSALTAQMNPHFVFNALNSIQHFIADSDKENALRYLSKFAKLIRMVLHHADKNTISIANELTMIQLYIELEVLRFSNKFTLKIVVSEAISQDLTFIPAMLIQPYVENAIMHGLLNKEGNGDLEVTMEMQNKLLLIRIKDNGIGRVAAAKIKQSKHIINDSMGMKLTAERMKVLSNLKQFTIAIEVDDRYDSAANPIGTLVTIKLQSDEYI